jgi:hypothetical protein
MNSKQGRTFLTDPVRRLSDLIIDEIERSLAGPVYLKATFDWLPQQMMKGKPTDLHIVYQDGDRYFDPGLPGCMVIFHGVKAGFDCHMLANRLSDVMWLSCKWWEQVEGRPTRPEPSKDLGPEWQNMKRLCERYLDELEHHREPDEERFNNIAWEALIILYGWDILNWIAAVKER